MTVGDLPGHHSIYMQSLFTIGVGTRGHWKHVPLKFWTQFFNFLSKMSDSKRLRQSKLVPPPQRRFGSYTYAFTPIARMLFIREYSSTALYLETKWPPIYCTYICGTVLL